MITSQDETIIRKMVKASKVKVASNPLASKSDWQRLLTDTLNTFKQVNKFLANNGEQPLTSTGKWDSYVKQRYYRFERMASEIDYPRFPVECPKHKDILISNMLDMLNDINWQVDQLSDNPSKPRFQGSPMY